MTTSAFCADLTTDDITNSITDAFDNIDMQNYLVSSETDIQRITADDTDGFKAILLNLFGDYETVVTDYEYRSTTGNVSHSIAIEKDYVWLCSAAIFAIILFCVFRFLYVLVK